MHIATLEICEAEVETQSGQLGVQSHCLAVGGNRLRKMLLAGSQQPEVRERFPISRIRRCDLLPRSLSLWQSLLLFECERMQSTALPCGRSLAHAFRSRQHQSNTCSKSQQPLRLQSRILTDFKL